ncbi:hypothetical protein GP486_005492 [Trichoglossum hirsutum]|uniref:Uncharacterized protein n=1 Tax=Trichoglossum hirsutum TaxID=265104 RepID=A0A9P8L949_9PEZI|nr:hypothetical protein GP486_005492 [Trichoglossum hirsutum]
MFSPEDIIRRLDVLRAQVQVMATQNASKATSQRASVAQHMSTQNADTGSVTRPFNETDGEAVSQQIPDFYRGREPKPAPELLTMAQLRTEKKSKDSSSSTLERRLTDQSSPPMLASPRELETQPRRVSARASQSALGRTRRTPAARTTTDVRGARTRDTASPDTGASDIGELVDFETAEQRKSRLEYEKSRIPIATDLKLPLPPNMGKVILTSRDTHLGGWLSNIRPSKPYLNTPFRSINKVVFGFLTQDCEMSERAQEKVSAHPQRQKGAMVYLRITRGKYSESFSLVDTKGQTVPNSIVCHSAEGTPTELQQSLRVLATQANLERYEPYRKSVVLYLHRLAIFEDREVPLFAVDESRDDSEALCEWGRNADQMVRNPLGKKPKVNHDDSSTRSKRLKEGQRESSTKKARRSKGTIPEDSGDENTGPKPNSGNQLATKRKFISTQTDISHEGSFERRDGGASPSRDATIGSDGPSNSSDSAICKVLLEKQ